MTVVVGVGVPAMAGAESAATDRFGDPVFRPAVVKPMWVGKSSRGDTNAAAYLACRDAFAADPALRVVVGTSAAVRDLTGWKFAADMSRSSRLAGRDPAAIVALCWVDGLDDDKTGAELRVLWVLGGDGSAVVLAVGRYDEVLFSSPQTKSVAPPASIVKRGSPDDTIPVIRFGEAERAKAEAVRRAQPGSTVPDEASTAQLTPVPVPADLGRRRVGDTPGPDGPVARDISGPVLIGAGVRIRPKPVGPPPSAVVAAPAGGVR